ncbi:hypothetical protein T552_01362 [Pneumocystis carinii B80]|uniref:Glutathione peroxidase n=1 Tax=Pneumocystis carinii (strain B80) TaxID=1408658 RepID=A0A0W4ZM17_PNEC8|nr:hypothetical protein T552_01362 [Pneumocystis carinii B80]KTW29410.1 hypothetical protein T552_01362 [Pneumocystis carinii B80]
MSFYDLRPKLNGQEYGFDQLKDKVVLVVNVASKCGFTSQYEGLEKLYQKYKDSGFEILAFPCNQFGNQEPGTNEEIVEFCSLKYQVTFPVFDKIKVNGNDADPVYVFLKSQKKGLLNISKIKWNFEKFLINKSGEVVNRYSSLTKPENISSDIEKLLA